MRKQLVTVTGAGGFVFGHMVRRLLDEGYDVRAVDIKPLPEWWQVHDCENQPGRDLMNPAACAAAVRGATIVVHGACPMGGIRWITEQLWDCARSSGMTQNMLQASIDAGVHQFTLSSSACAYGLPWQGDAEHVTALSEDMAWPLQGEPGYGLSKGWEEKLCEYAAHDTDLDVRVARFHNIYGPSGSWEGGKEKAPAAICRKVAEAIVTDSHEIEIWGDGEQRRTFCWVDDCVEGVRRLMASDYSSPVNIGSSELVSINELVSMVEDIAGVTLRRNYDLSAPTGVRGRSSDNALCRRVLDGWEPSTPLRVGMERLYSWVEGRVMERHG